MQPWAHGKQVGHQACYLLFSSVYRLISKPDVTALRREKMATGRCPAAAAALLLPALLWLPLTSAQGGFACGSLQVGVCLRASTLSTPAH